MHAHKQYRILVTYFRSQKCENHGSFTKIIAWAIANLWRACQKWNV